MSSQLDHFRHGTVAVNSSTPLLVGSYFGVLVISGDTTFSTLDSDAENPDVLIGVTYGAGTYLPLHVSSIKVSAGAVLVGNTHKRKS